MGKLIKIEKKQQEKHNAFKYFENINNSMLLSY